MDDFIDASRRCADNFRQAVLADSEFVEKLRQVFSRMNRVDIGHGVAPVFQLRVVYDRPSALYMDSRDTGVLIVHKVSRSLLNPVD